MRTVCMHDVDTAARIQEVDEEQDDGVVSEMSNEYSDDDDPGACSSRLTSWENCSPAVT